MNARIPPGLSSLGGHRAPGDVHRDGPTRAVRPSRGQACSKAWLPARLTPAAGLRADVWRETCVPTAKRFGIIVFSPSRVTQSVTARGQQMISLRMAQCRSSCLGQSSVRIPWNRSATAGAQHPEVTGSPFNWLSQGSVFTSEPATGGGRRHRPPRLGTIRPPTQGSRWIAADVTAWGSHDSG